MYAACAAYYGPMGAPGGGAGPAARGGPAGPRGGPGGRSSACGAGGRKAGRLGAPCRQLDERGDRPRKAQDHDGRRGKKEPAAHAKRALSFALRGITPAPSGRCACCTRLPPLFRACRAAMPGSVLGRCRGAAALRRAVLRHRARRVRAPRRGRLGAAPQRDLPLNGVSPFGNIGARRVWAHGIRISARRLPLLHLRPSFRPPLCRSLCLCAGPGSMRELLPPQDGTPCKCRLLTQFNGSIIPLFPALFNRVFCHILGKLFSAAF